jgi:hypothetical protein
MGTEGFWGGGDAVITNGITGLLDNFTTSSKSVAIGSHVLGQYLLGQMLQNVALFHKKGVAKIDIPYAQEILPQ